MVDPEALRKAAMAGDVAATRKLLDAGADPNTKIAGHPILTLVCDSRHRLTYMEGGSWHDVAQLLLERGADVHAKNQHGQQAIHQCVRMNADTLPALLRAGADLGAVDAHGKLPIEIAIRYGLLETVEALLEGGAPLPAGVESNEYWGTLANDPVQALKVLAAERPVRATALARKLDSAMPQAPTTTTSRPTGPSPL